MSVRFLVKTTAATFWLIAMLSGIGAMLVYASKPGDGSDAPITWPADSTLDVSADRATLVVFLHPHCPCSRATLQQLQRILLAAAEPIRCHAVFVLPPGTESGWEAGSLWKSVASISGVSRSVDHDGAEAIRFDAATSGQTLLYDRDKRLAFHGGITVSRGHVGGSDGSRAITALLSGATPAVNSAPVFGCPLFDMPSCCEEPGT